MTPPPSDALAATTAAGYAKRIRCMPGTAPANCQRAIAAPAFRARAIHGCDDRRWMMSQSTELGPCPRCGKREGEFIDSPHSLPLLRDVQAFPFMTDLARTPAVATKLWNEAKPAEKTRKAP